MKNLTYIFALLSLYSCLGANKDQKLWLMHINLQEQDLKVIIHIDKNNNYLINSDEKISLSPVNNNFKIGSHYSHLSIDLKDQKGLWVRENKENYQVPLTLEPIDKTDLFEEYEKKECKQTIAGKWRINLSETNTGLGNFKQIGCRLKGSILTETGDYRYLDGFIKNNSIHIQGFDGVFSFIFKLKFISPTSIEGTMYSGKSYNTPIKASKDEKFKLTDANKMTRILEHKEINLLLKDIEGNLIDLTKPLYQNKVIILQLFGSWCPNCLDETNFFNQWKKDHPNLASNVAFIALAFENFPNEKAAIKALKKAKDKLSMNYPVILVDYNKKIKASDILPIDQVRAFPTTLYLDKNKKVVKVHTGFSGPATGIFFEEYVKDFTSTIKKLIHNQ